jgi:hypothetical protein
MRIDWERAINEIFSEKIACLRCGKLCHEVYVGYSRAPGAAAYSPRHHECPQKDECDARKLVVVCESCAKELRLRARKVDEETMMGMIMAECRRELDESLDYLAEYWQEELDVGPEEMDKRLEEVDPEAFAEEDRRRARLEEEYLQLHRWFREHGKRIPDPGWRSEYVEEIIALGYTTRLGD